VDELAQTDVLIIGSLGEVLRRCGKPSCRCAERPGHRLLSTLDNSKVSQGALEGAEEATPRRLRVI
jgi:hypothetical protein